MAAPRGLAQPWGAVGPPSSPGEEANPFSFKEFVRSKNQSVGATTGGNCDGSPELGGSGSTSPKESTRHTLILDNDSLSPKTLGLSLGFQEPFFQDPTITNPLLEDEDDWSGTYQPSAVEQAHLTGDSSCSMFDSFYCNASELAEIETPPPWPLNERDTMVFAARGKRDPTFSALGDSLGDGHYTLQPLDYEDLKEENSKLKSMINKLQTVSESQTDRVKQLERKLEEKKIKEQREARDLESMVQHVEESLQLMTARAMKAETNAAKLKQENALLQIQLTHYKMENEALKSGQSSSLAVVKKNADVALQNLLTVIANSRASIKQLVSGAESLQLVAELLKSIDKISEISEDGS
uniref:Endosome-associated-trafficking regulator 1 n=1 Tax=Sphenodon punctatus TaxID=8508 RepID=A0A8D0HQ99_SPHPU